MKTKIWTKKISKEYTIWLSPLADMNCKNLERITKPQEIKHSKQLSWTKMKKMQRKISTSTFSKYRMIWIKKSDFTPMYKKAFWSRLWWMKTRGTIQWRLTCHLESNTSEGLSDSVCPVLSSMQGKKMKAISKSYTYLQWHLVSSSWQSQNYSMKVLKNKALTSKTNWSTLITSLSISWENIMQSTQMNSNQLCPLTTYWTRSQLWIRLNWLSTNLNDPIFILRTILKISAPIFKPW